jgi:hypothetical protein
MTSLGNIFLEYMPEAGKVFVKGQKNIFRSVGKRKNWDYAGTYKRKKKFTDKTQKKVFEYNFFKYKG